jgi:broad specificity phosphatase PhoE
VRVYLIRHAECEDNLIEADPTRRMTRAEFNKFVLSSPDSPLTYAGIEQAQRLVQHFTTRPISRLYSSPLPRALATAAALAEAYHLVPQVIADLRELLPPPFNEHGASFTASVRWLFLQGYLRMVFSSDSEDRLSIARHRARAVWEQMTREPAEAIAAVSHGWFIMLLLTILSGDPSWQVVKRDLNNAGVSLVVSR